MNVAQPKSDYPVQVAQINLPAWSELLDMSGHERVLEVGCGDCSFLAALAPVVGELVGLESTAVGAIGAHELLKTLDKPSTLYIGNLLNFSDDRGFDVIIIRKGLDAVGAAHRQAWCDRIASLLRAGGLVYLTDGTARVEHWLSGDDGWHASVINAGLTIRREVVKVPEGLEVLAMKPEASANGRVNAA